jgi:hypothetical protein
MNLKRKRLRKRKKEYKILRENDGGVNLIKIYYKHIWKCHNESLSYNYSMLINFKIYFLLK